MTRKLAVLEAGVLAGALVLRLAGLWAISQTPHAEALTVDAHLYWRQAQALAAGEPAFGEGLYQPPGYPMFLGLIAAAGGGLASVRAVQAALGLLSTWLVLRLGRRLGDADGRPWMGALAAGIFTLHPSVLLFEQDLLTPALSTVLFLGAVELLAPWWSGRSVLWRPAVAGLLLGVGGVVHPTALAAGAALGGLLLLRSRPAGLVLGLGLVLALAPTTLENHRAHGVIAPVSHNGGLNAYLGNNPDWKRTSFLRPGPAFRAFVMAAEPWSRDLPGRDAYWWARTRQEAVAAPGAVLGALATKAVWSVSDRAIPRNEDMRCRTRWSSMGWLGLLPARFGLVFGPALVGLVVLWRRRSEAGAVVLAGLALQLGMVLFLVADRYRLGPWPVWALAAAVGAPTLLAALRARARWPWLVVPLAALPFVPLDPVTAEDPAWCAHVRGNLMGELGRGGQAQAAFEEAVRLDPSDAAAWEWLGRHYVREGELVAAGQAYDAVLAEVPDHYPTLMRASLLAERSGERDRAYSLAVAAAALPPGRDEAKRRVEELRAGLGDGL